MQPIGTARTFRRISDLLIAILFTPAMPDAVPTADLILSEILLGK